MLTIEQRRKTDRKRRERWRKKKLAQGCKQIQLMLAPEAQAILERMKSRTGEPYVQIIHRAIFELDQGHSRTSFKTKTQSKISKKNRVRIGDSKKSELGSTTSEKQKTEFQGQLKLF